MQRLGGSVLQVNEVSVFRASTLTVPTDTFAAVLFQRKEGGDPVRYHPMPGMLC